MILPPYGLSMSHHNDEDELELISNPRGVPTACIQLPGSVRSAYCSRTLLDNEFRFQDARHASLHYRDSKHLRACPRCLEGCKDDVAPPAAAPLDMSPAGMGGRR